MTKEQMNQFVNELASEFMNLYHIHISKEEYDPIILTGYCLYFASLLQQLFKDGQVFRPEHIDHYIFYYEEEYYDGLGVLEKYNTTLYSTCFGFIPINTLQEIKNIKEEIDYTSCCDFDYSYKQMVWQKIGPLLYEYGIKRIHEIKNRQTRKQTKKEIQ